MAAVNPEIVRILRDERSFISRLPIEDEEAQVRRFNDPYSHQIPFLNALMDPEVREIVAYKPRQVGWTLTNCADTFYQTFTANRPLRTLIATNHNKTTKSIFGKFDRFRGGLPKAIVGINPIHRNIVDKTFTFGANKALIDHITMRGDSQARSWTYQRLVAEELAFWPNAEDGWAVVTSAVPRPEKTVIISTANGPGGLYHDMVKRARQAQQRGETWVRWLWARWADHRHYRLRPPTRWEPTHEEYELSRIHGLTVEQMYWRHDKIWGVRGIGERRFRREYPLTEEDGFLVIEGGFFDVDFLNILLTSLDRKLEKEVRIYRRPVPNMTYAIGVDPAWCSGSDVSPWEPDRSKGPDAAVAQVLDHKGRQCATLSMVTGGDELFSRRVSDLARAYNNARVLVESNPGGGGRNVIKQLAKDGVRLWREPRTRKHFTTTSASKSEGYGHLRRMVDGDVLELTDHATLIELMHIREDEMTGRIEGEDGYHDDHADALMLAEWNRRTLPKAENRVPGSRRRYTSKAADPMSAVHRAIS